MGKGFVRLFGYNRLLVLAAAGALAATAFAVAPPGANVRAGGPHMSPRLQAIKGPAISTLVPDATQRACLFASLGASCYGPYDLGKIYNFPANLDGRGQTIIIVDAYGSPTMASDLALFDRYFGIPAPPSFTIINATGTGATGSGGVVGWAIETSLDVEYAHAMAPGANIVLAVGATDNNFDLNAAEAQVFPRYPGAIVSQSFGDWETDATAGTSFADQHKIFERATRMGDTILASAGDAGATWTQYTGTTSPALASYPASDPLVTSVGGTQGNPYPGGLEVAGAYGGEATWNEPRFDAATGGAPSILFRAPSWQRGVTGYRTRTVPDVAYDAAINGGVEVILSPNLYLVGGTSVGSPQWAAIFAIVNQARASSEHDPIGLANPALYKLGKQQYGSAQGHQNGEDSSPAFFHDITTGNNALDSTIGFSAKRGYDLTTGWGTPNVANLVAALSRGSSDHSPEANDPESIRVSTSSTGRHASQTMGPE
jgi:subtilase family serine protease